MDAVSSLMNRHILVVEDDFFLADDLARSLRSHGAIVVGPLANVERALALVTSNERLDAAVLDISVRERLTYPVAEALLAREVPFDFVSGFDQSVIPDEFSHFPRVTKPSQLSDILAVLRDILPAADGTASAPQGTSGDSAVD